MLSIYLLCNKITSWFWVSSAAKEFVYIPLLSPKANGGHKCAIFPKWDMGGNGGNPIAPNGGIYRSKYPPLKT